MTTLFAQIVGHSERAPGHFAILTEEDGTRTYRQLVDRSAALGLGLIGHLGMAAGDRLCIWAVNQPAWVEAFLAANATGVISVSANPDWTDNETLFILRHAEVRTIVCDADLAARACAMIAEVPSLERVIAIANPGEAVPDGAVNFEDLIALAPADPLRSLPPIGAGGGGGDILYTSGTSSGRPKAVERRADTPNAGLADYQEMIGIEPRDRAIVLTPFFHGNGWGGVRSALAYGASVVFPRRFSASRFWSLVDLYRPTYLYSIGAIANILLGQRPSAAERHHQIRVGIVVGAAASAPAIEERFGFPVIDWYGMTEAGFGTYTRLDEDRKVGSAGRRFRGSTMTIVRPDGTEADPGETGEVVFARDGIAFKEYVADAEATEAVTDSTWFHTGDLGYFDADGYFFFVDRLKDIVRRGGENISSMEIEGVLRLHPAVADAAIVAKPDPVLGERVVAFVARSGAAVTDQDELRSFVAERLARFKVPEEIFVLDELPRTGSGKVIKAILRERLLSL